MKLKRLAQSTVQLTARSGVSLLVDPGKYNLDPGRFTADTFPVTDVVVITHKHADHFDLDLVKRLVARSKPRILTNHEIHAILAKEGIGADAVSAGQEVGHSGVNISIVPADHFVRGEQIVNFGIVVAADGATLYHTSDTRFMDADKLPTICRAQYLLVPISDRGVVMGVDDAAVFASELKPKLAIPVHYDSPKDKDRVIPAEFVEKARGLGVDARVLAFGEELEL